jgi:hypothetical protein
MRKPGAVGLTRAAPLAWISDRYSRGAISRSATRNEINQSEEKWL